MFAEGGGNAEGSSEEINSDDSMFDSSSHINWDHGDNASDLPELESCSNPRGGASQNSAGAEDRGGPHRVRPPVSELLSVQEGKVANSSRGTEVQQTLLLPAGYSDGRDPLGTYPRCVAEKWVTPLPGHKFKSYSQVMETKAEMRHLVSSDARSVEAKKHHKKSNGGNRRSRGGFMAKRKLMQKADT